MEISNSNASEDLSRQTVILSERKAKIQADVKYINKAIISINNVLREDRDRFPDLSIPEIYQHHVELILEISTKVCLRHQRRKFEVDQNNKKVLKFLTYYFNNCELAETVFPEKGYKLEKNLLIMGPVGSGKTLLMQIFSEYLKHTGNPNFFHNVSVTQMVNYYTLHGHLDKYTYNEENSTGFMPKPENVCLNDIGLESRIHYGQDTKILTKDFLHARNEIWAMTAYDQRKFAHLTTNLNKKQLEEEFKDSFGRLLDRFKTYNVIELNGLSRR